MNVACLGGGELGDSLGSLRDGVLGKLSGKHEADSSLDLARRKGGLLVVGRELSGLSGNTLEDVVDEGVHDGHSLLADAGVGVDLLEDLVDVGRVGLDALLGTLLLAVSGLGGFGCLGRCLLGGCFGHGCGGVDVDFGNEICEHDVEFVVGAVWPCVKCVVGRALFQYKSTCVSVSIA